MMNSQPHIHPAALVESEQIGAGTRIWAFAHVMSGAVIGADCNIGDHAFIEDGARIGNRVTVKNNSLVWHGVTIEDDVFIGPNVVFTNDPNPRVRFKKPPEAWISTLVREGASIGANATIVCGTSLGRHSMVGAGSLVVDDVVDYALVYGNPARWRAWICECGIRLDAELVCECGRSYSQGPGGLLPA
jgi:UDP-2-acetamido-3-amino-2,3-dideoxy-glucuronate N-acetyltransferase